MDLNPNPDPTLDPESEDLPDLTVRAPGYQPISQAHSPILSSEYGSGLPAGEYPAL